VVAAGKEASMEVQEILDEARKSVGAKGVYADPVVQNGMTVIPAATVAGGGGAGSGESSDGHGGGGGFGVKSRPTGAWVIENGVVRWKTAYDLNRILLGAELVALAGIFAARTIFGPRPVSRSGTRRFALPRLSWPGLPRLRRKSRSLPVVHVSLPQLPAIRR
jgi:Sporulation protein YtfJ (Spore_YtfJ)